MQGDPLSHSISPPSPPSTSISSHLTRKSAFHQALSSEVVNLRDLRSLAAGSGFPDDDPSIRAQVWQLFLGYLPLERSQWDNSIKKKETEYLQFCSELIIDPQTLGRPPAELEEAAAAALQSSLASSSSGPLSLERTTVSHDDHPLSTSDSSRWRAFFADAEIKEQIERDVDRTHPDLHFFSGPTPTAQGHRAAMRRALFIFAKLNPGLQYVQGMNELFAVLYHTFAIGGGSTSKNYGGGGDDDANKKVLDRVVSTLNQPSSAESAAFFCFIHLLGEFRDNFCQQLDNSTIGIKGTLGKLSSFLKSFDLSLWTHLEQKNGVNPQFYAFRWITTLLTQEFNFPDVIRLWDTLVLDDSPEGRPECLLRICLAMVLLVRDQLLAGDFASNLKLLQHYPQSIDVALVLKTAEELKNYKTIIVLDE